MRKSRKWREKRGDRKKSPLIMRGPTKWIPTQKENKITKKMDYSYMLVQDDEESNTWPYESIRFFIQTTKSVKYCKSLILLTFLEGVDIAP